MLRYSCTFILIFLCYSVSSQRIRVSDNGRFLITEEEKPFFWLADTAWELFHRCDLEEANTYLTKRAEQGFNVIQAVALSELDGLNTPNPYGHAPLHDNDPAQPNEAYFQHVDAIIQQADRLGLYMAILPTWGDKVFKSTWGKGPEIFTPETARNFGQWIGTRYKDYDNIIWIIGGDRNPRPESKDVEIWNAMAEGIAASAGGYEKTLMSFHPQPKEGGGSSTWFHNEKWLDFNMHQTGHCPANATYKSIMHDYKLEIVKPVLDAEPLYEDHPYCFNAKENGHSVPEDIRRIMYWNVFAGAFGQTYGCHDVWQMYKLDKEPVNNPGRPWPKALDLPMANQVKHLKNLFLSRPYLTRMPDQSMVKTPQKEDNSYVIATRDSEGSYAMVYFPTGAVTELNLSMLSGGNLNLWWYDPRTGNAYEASPIAKSATVSITPPTSGTGHDWVLVVDDASRKFEAPGTIVKL